MTEAGNIELRFEVEDTGIGISTEQQARLFTPFAQADAFAWQATQCVLRSCHNRSTSCSRVCVQRSLPS